MLDIKTLEGWLWEAACKIRGEIDAPKYKDYILPLIFLKRLSDVFDDELEKLALDCGGRKEAIELLEEDHSLVWFYLPKNARWENLEKQATGLGEYLTDAVRATARENQRLAGVIDIVDYNATAAGQRIITDDKLKTLISILGRHRLGLKDVEPDIIGRAYEYLLRKFAEGSGQSAGEFYTPREVAILMAEILSPSPGQEIYDPCAGSAGLLIKCFLKYGREYGNNPKNKPVRFYGQEILHSTYAMARINCFIHRMEAEIALGDTMNNPRFLEKDGSLSKYDIVTANPMWNQDFAQSVYENDRYNRFTYGIPPSSSADWGWIQHMTASLKKNGKMAVVLDTGAVSRGSGNAGANRERDIRKKYVEKDEVEAVILLPENLFYNTTAPGIILVINKNKKHKKEIMLINASKLFEKGRPKNSLTEEHIKKIASLYHDWKEETGASRIISTADAEKNDYNLSPTRYITQNNGPKALPLEEAIVLLKEAEEEQKGADEKLKKILGEMGLG
ncbi:MAG: SAM-dependent DNA methyltransferase [Candidatus Altiarchaeota archaeon]|nr:SAM-dependent DNA methyltransferase [Candidatus Altiarchaeota archaeon]